MFGSSARRAPALLAFAAAISSGGCLDRPLCADCAPETTNVFATRVQTSGVDKVDLLFMIDGSVSMADKQELLARAVPPLLARFVNPLCVDDQGRPNGEQSENGQCKSGTAQFPPVPDIHIGVISSNLGAAGADSCAATGMFDDDHAWLIPRVRPEEQLDSYDGTGFLAWDPRGDRNVPPGSNDAVKLGLDFKSHVSAVRENGCGLEASLESWYRFLIDPNPPERIVIENDRAVAVGTDTALLEQRARFLRPDSLVAIVMLTDENDCSLQRRPDARWVGQQSHPDWPQGVRMPRGSSACATDPNDPCCRPCTSQESSPPPGCGALANDPECQKNDGLLTREEDPVNLRCFDQKRRFGVDLLEPVEKYIRALTADTVFDSAGQEHPNPLFVAPPGKAPRAKNLVFLAGIVGVPWQDIATPESLTGPGLAYLTPEQLVQQGRWELILGDPSKGIPPKDPHMIESVAPRSGTHPFVSDGILAPPTTANPRADVISGHEQVTQARDDLQYACIFELPNPRDCSGKGASCDCNLSEGDQRPLCRPPGGGPVGTTQYFAKAYPGTRHLQVLKGLGSQGVVASICPKVTQSSDPEADPNYGYNPAVESLFASIAKPLSKQCLGRAPALDDSGQLRCVVVEAQLGGTCDCSLPGRTPARPEVMRTIRRDMAEDSACDTPGGPPCSSICGCELQEAEGAALDACRTQRDPASQAPGYCYIDPAAGIGDPALVRDCPDTKKRILRFVGPDTPATGTFAYMACMGANISR